MNIVKRAASTFREEGALAVAKKAPPYLFVRVVRPRLPRRETTYNGVRVRASRWFDDVVPVGGHPNPEAYEAALVDGIQNTVRNGDTVTMIGGGWGVSGVVAAREAGPDSRVVIYEGSEDHVRFCRETARLNDVSGRIQVKHGIVSHARNLHGDAGGAPTIPPEDLAECDVLIVDCDGAEVNILRNLSMSPREIVVETHGHLGTSPDLVTEALEDASYRVLSRQPAEEPPLAEGCRNNGVFVLTAESVAHQVSSHPE